MPRFKLAVEAAAEFAKLFGAVVLGLVPTTTSDDRLRWVASGFLVLGLGGTTNALPTLLPQLTSYFGSDTLVVYTCRYPSGYPFS